MNAAGIILLCTILFLFSCAPAKQAIFFNNLQPGKDTLDQKITEATKRIYPGDRVAITITTQNSEANELFSSGMNFGGNMGGGGGMNNIGAMMFGYLVDKNGEIELPVVGKLTVSGLTPEEVSDYVKLKVSKFYKDPSVTSFLSGRVVVLGGSGVQGSVPILNNRMTILEAVALSGVVDPTARRDRVWVVREKAGLRDYAMVDLSSRTIFESEYYYLRNNDLIYVEPGRLNTFLGVNAPARNLFGAIVSSLALVISIIAITQ